MRVGASKTQNPPPGYQEGGGDSINVLLLSMETITCAGCQVTTPKGTGGRPKKYCSNKCRSRVINAKAMGKDPYHGLGTGTIGTIGELAVSVDLLQRGCNVFRALHPNAAFDLVVVRGTTAVGIEVRTGRKSLKGNILFSQRPEDIMGGAALYAVHLRDEPSPIYSPINDVGRQFIKEQLLPMI